MKGFFITGILIELVLLSSCASPFAPVIVAPASTTTILSPDELPVSLRGKIIIWHGIVDLSKGIAENELPKDSTNIILSNNQRYLSYMSSSLVMGADGIPTITDEAIKLYDLKLNVEKELVNKKRLFPDAIFLEASKFETDDQSIIFIVTFENAVDLARVNILNGKIERLNVDVLLTNFGYPDVSSNGQIVVICKGAKQDNTSELCLLDEGGKFIRYLTSEGYPWPGYGLFTPDGKYVLYESRYKLYKVKTDGGKPQQIAPCGNPLMTSDDYVILWCFVAQNPDCYGLFIANLDGTDFRRIGYINEFCNDK